jgi:nucleoid-associated protein YgaU
MGVSKSAPASRFALVHKLRLNAAVMPALSFLQHVPGLSRLGIANGAARKQAHATATRLGQFTDSKNHGVYAKCNLVGRP